MKRNQGALEYVIIIGGVIILAAATYFMLKGFSQTTGAGTTETIGVAGEKYMLELKNLGRSETKFSAKKWTNPLLQKRTLMEFSSLGDVTFNATNLTAHGVQVSSLEFDCFGTGFCELNYTIAGEILTVHTTGKCCTQDFDLYMFYNNLTALINPCLANYTGPPRTSCGTIPLPDSIPPSINISSTAFGSSGSVKDAVINVTVNGTGSNVSEAYYKIDDSAWFPVNNLYYGQGGMTAEAHPVDGQYDDEFETIQIIVTVPSEANYTVRVLARDEYGNEVTEEKNVSIEIAGSPVDLTPPVILSTEPANNTLVKVSLLTLKITTNEVAHCRFANVSGTAYSSMNDFNNTDSTNHNITNIALTYGQNYKYYFKCNDTSGNVNPSDYMLNFTRNGWTIIQLTNSTYGSSFPAIAVDGVNVHVVGVLCTELSCEVHHMNSSDGGVTWSDPHQISNAGEGEITYLPRMGVNGSNLHVVWEDTRAPVSQREIYYANSSDGGITWSENYKISPDAGTYNFRHPSIAVEGSEVHAVWEVYSPGQRNISYRKSSDGGVTWSGIYGFETNDSRDPFLSSLAADGNNVHVTWVDNNDYALYYVNSSDGGSTWNNYTQLSNLSFEPSIGVNGDKVHLIGSAFELNYMNSSDGGTTWSSEYNLTNGSWIIESCTIENAIYGNNVHVVWTDAKGPSANIYYLHSPDGGTSWSEPYLLTNDSAHQFEPQIAVSGNDVYVVWYDDGVWEIYFAHV